MKSERFLLQFCLKINKKDFSFFFMWLKVEVPSKMTATDFPNKTFSLLSDSKCN